MLNKVEQSNMTLNHLFVYQFEGNNETTTSFLKPRTCVSCTYGFECESDTIAPFDDKQR